MLGFPNCTMSLFLLFSIDTSKGALNLVWPTLIEEFLFDKVAHLKVSSTCVIAWASLPWSLDHHSLHTATTPKVNIISKNLETPQYVLCFFPCTICFISIGLVSPDSMIKSKLKTRLNCEMWSLANYIVYCRIMRSSTLVHTHINFFRKLVALSVHVKNKKLKKHPKNA